MSLYPHGEDESSFSVFDAVEKPGSMLTKDVITNGHFFKIFSVIGWFPIEPVSIVLSDDAEPVQKLACRVPVALKDKFKQELQSMEKAGIISKLDHNIPAPWLNSRGFAKDFEALIKWMSDFCDPLIHTKTNSSTIVKLQSD